MPPDPDTDIGQGEKAYRQLEIYARDFQELYWQERQKRAELAQEKLVLQYKLRELEGLNKLFQKYLEQKAKIDESYNELVEGMKKLLADRGDLRAGLQQLISKAESRPGGN